MARDKYENDKDRENEERIARWVGKEWGLTFKKLSPYGYGVDYALFNGKACKAFIETKRRNVAFEAYPTICLAVSKLMAARRLYEVTALPCYFVVHFDDALKFVDLTYEPNELWVIELAGRADRDDEYDEEPCAMIPAGRFLDVKGTGKHG